MISSLPGSALRTHDESLGKPRDVNKRSQSLACNLISKDTHLVFSIYLATVIDQDVWFHSEISLNFNISRASVISKTSYGVITIDKMTGVFAKYVSVVRIQFRVSRVFNTVCSIAKSNGNLHCYATQF